MKCTFEELERRDGNTVFIRDLDGNMSVTNDAEAVLDYYKKQGIDIVIYEDTIGLWTKMYYGETNTWMGKGIGVVFEPL